MTRLDSYQTQLAKGEAGAAVDEEPAERFEDQEYLFDEAVQCTKQLINDIYGGKREQTFFKEMPAICEGLRGARKKSPRRVTGRTILNYFRSREDPHLYEVTKETTWSYFGFRQEASTAGIRSKEHES